MRAERKTDASSFRVMMIAARSAQNDAETQSSGRGMNTGIAVTRTGFEPVA